MFGRWRVCPLELMLHAEALVGIGRNIRLIILCNFPIQPVQLDVSGRRNTWTANCFLNKKTPKWQRCLFETPPPGNVRCAKALPWMWASACKQPANQQATGWGLHQRGWVSRYIPGSLWISVSVWMLVNVPSSHVLPELAKYSLHKVFFYFLKLELEHVVEILTLPTEKGNAKICCH